MAPTMDIDENDNSKAAATAELAMKKSNPTQGAPSSSVETAAKHPSMALAQDIHRLLMVHSGKLSSEEALSIMGIPPEMLLIDVLCRVGAGGQTVQAAIQESETRFQRKLNFKTKLADKSSKNVGGEVVKKEEIDEKKHTEQKVQDEVNEPILNAALYQYLVTSLSITAASFSQPMILLSPSDLELIASHHTENIKTLNDLVSKAEEEAGDMEVLQAKMDLAQYCAKSCTKQEAFAAYDQVVTLPKLSLGKKLDAFMEMARLASFWGDWKKMREILEKASKVIANGGDWDRRNRLKAYQAISFLLVRDMKSATKLLVDGIATFSCTELCEYPEFITYAVVTSLIHLPRTELKKSIIDGSEVLQVANEIPLVVKLANTLYDCDYNQFLHTLVALNPHLIANRYLQPHAGYLIRELHVLGYRQFLDSYQSVTLESMAASFGVGAEFLDSQLSRFIAAGRLTAKIDKFGGVVETNRPDWKNARYREMIQKGDLLLNRIQKLGRVVDL